MTSEFLAFAPSSHAALGAPTVAGALDPGIEWARGVATDPSVLEAFVLVRSVAEACEPIRTCNKEVETLQPDSL